MYITCSICLSANIQDPTIPDGCTHVYCYECIEKHTGDTLNVYLQTKQKYAHAGNVLLINRDVPIPSCPVCKLYYGALVKNIISTEKYTYRPVSLFPPKSENYRNLFLMAHAVAAEVWNRNHPNQKVNTKVSKSGKLRKKDIRTLIEPVSIVPVEFIQIFYTSITPMCKVDKLYTTFFKDGFTDESVDRFFHFNLDRLNENNVLGRIRRKNKTLFLLHNLQSYCIESKVQYPLIHWGRHQVADSVKSQNTYIKNINSKDVILDMVDDIRECAQLITNNESLLLNLPDTPQFLSHILKETAEDRINIMNDGGDDLNNSNRKNLRKGNDQGLLMPTEIMTVESWNEWLIREIQIASLSNAAEYPLIQELWKLLPFMSLTAKRILFECPEEDLKRKINWIKVVHSWCNLHEFDAVYKLVKHNHLNTFLTRILIWFMCSWATCTPSRKEECSSHSKIIFDEEQLLFIDEKTTSHKRQKINSVQETVIQYNFNLVSAFPSASWETLFVSQFFS
jgi:hypothetical protein